MFHHTVTVTRVHTVHFLDNHELLLTQPMLRQCDLMKKNKRAAYSNVIAFVNENKSHPRVHFQTSQWHPRMLVIDLGSQSCWWICSCCKPRTMKRDENLHFDSLGELLLGAFFTEFCSAFREKDLKVRAQQQVFVFIVISQLDGVTSCNDDEEIFSHQKRSDLSTRFVTRHKISWDWHSARAHAAAELDESAISSTRVWKSSYISCSETIHRLS